LLAAWLVLTLPLVVLAAARRRGTALGTAQGAARVALWVVVALALAAAVSTRSLTGLAALAIEALLAAWLVRPARRVALAATGLLALAAVPRLVTLASGADPSGSGRRLFAEAAWRALVERPWLGHGPGSVGWMSALYLRPEPGISLPSEVVGQLHAVPLDLLFELGLVGTLAAAAVVALFVRARWQEGRRAEWAGDRGAARAASIALAGGAVTALGNGWLEVPALTAALCLAAAVWLAASGSAAAHGRDGGAAPVLAGRVGERRWPGRLYALLAGCLLLPLTVAQWRYDRATALAPSAASSVAVVQSVSRSLARAVALDPVFPLYRARWAEALGDPAGSQASDSMPLAWRAAQARRAAEAAVGVAALWLSAGRLEQAAGMASADSSLRRALALDPLAPYAAFERALSGHLPQREAAECAARALLAEPRLAAALAFEQQPELLAGTAQEILGWQGIDAGWRIRMGQLLAAQKRLQQRLRQADSPPASEDAVGRLVYGAEAGAAAGLSLYGFRRSPWPRGWLEVAVRLERARAFDLPPATRLATSSAAAFPPDRCAP
jgi:O-antigen ligase